jgi:hypothetical protein
VPLTADDLADFQGGLTRPVRWTWLEECVSRFSISEADAGSGYRRGLYSSSFGEKDKSNGNADRCNKTHPNPIASAPSSDIEAQEGSDKGVKNKQCQQNGNQRDQRHAHHQVREDSGTKRSIRLTPDNIVRRSICLQREVLGAAVLAA